VLQYLPDLVQPVEPGEDFGGLLAVFEAYVEFLADVAIEGGDFTAARGGDFEGDAGDVSGRGCVSARGCSFHKNEFGLIEFNFYRCDFDVPYNINITLFNGTWQADFFGGRKNRPVKRKWL
jgi:hypothetical protein